MGFFHKMDFRKSFLVLFFLSLVSCAGGGATTISSTSQTLSNQGLQFLAALAQQFDQDLSGTFDCTQFQQTLNNLVGTSDCSLGGSQTLELLQSTCADAPSFNGQASLSLTFQNCEEPGQSLGGTLRTDLDWDGALLTDQTQSSDFFFNGLFYSIQTLIIEVDAMGVPTCSGALLIQGDLCGVSSDCNFCPFQ